jgi:hypothetical protein
MPRSVIFAYGRVFAVVFFMVLKIQWANAPYRTSELLQATAFLPVDLAIVRN